MQCYTYIDTYDDAMLSAYVYTTQLCIVDAMFSTHNSRFFNLFLFGGWDARAGWARPEPAVFREAAGEKDAAELAQKLGHLQPFVAEFPQSCVGKLGPFGPT
jgi:hypothetical protein